MTDKALKQALEKEKARNRTLEKRLYEAEKMASIGLLAGGITHEIQNPLAVINANYQLLEELIASFSQSHPACASDPDFTELTDVALDIEKGLSHLLAVVTNFKTNLSHSDQNKTETSLNQCVLSACSMLSSEVKKGLTLHTHLDESLPAVIANPVKIQQALLNLLLNARQACGDNGEITVTTTLDHHNEIINLSVTDNGHGVPDEIAGRIFKPFFSTKDAKNGTGLGLAICHTIMKDHGGSISFQSDTSSGTCFTLSFPLES